MALPKYLKTRDLPKCPETHPGFRLPSYCTHRLGLPTEHLRIPETHTIPEVLT